MWAMTNPDLDAEDQTRLVAAEDKLIGACNPVNTLATTSLDGGTVTVTQGVDANSAKSSCAKQVKKVEKLIWEVDPEVAQAYWDCKGCALKESVADNNGDSGS